MASYSGLGKYAFVSYSHKNAGVVLDVINRLTSRGVHIWYDENLGPSDEYIEVIAEKVEKSDFFIAFLSEDSLSSRYCRDEIRFAYESGKDMMIIYVDRCELSAGYKMMLNGVQSFTLGDKIEKESIDKIMSGIPRTVVDLIPGEKIYETNGYVFSFEEKSYGNGYIVHRISKADGNDEQIISEGFPPASDYRLNYVTRPRSDANWFEINITVVWDFTYTYYREDEYFEETYLYDVINVNSENCRAIKNTTQHRDLNTGEYTVYNYVSGVNTIRSSSDKTTKIRGTDITGHYWNVEKKDEEK